MYTLLSNSLSIELLELYVSAYIYRRPRTRLIYLYVRVCVYTNTDILYRTNIKKKEPKKSLLPRRSTAHTQHTLENASQTSRGRRRRSPDVPRIYSMSACNPTLTQSPIHHCSLISFFFFIPWLGIYSYRESIVKKHGRWWLPGIFFVYSRPATITLCGKPRGLMWNQLYNYIEKNKRDKTENIKRRRRRSNFALESIDWML